MTEVPNWLLITWLVITGFFFLVNLLLYAALVMAVLKLKAAIDDARPRIISLTEQGKLLATRVTEISHRVEEIAVSLRENVETVGGKAKGVVGSAELVAHSASKQFERFSPFVVGAITAMRLIKALNEMRKGVPGKVATKKGFLDRIPARKKKKSGILDILLRK